MFKENLGKSLDKLLYLLIALTFTPILIASQSYWIIKE